MPRGKRRGIGPASSRQVLRVEDLPPEIREVVARFAKDEKPKKKPKYGNSWVEVDGIKFQSKREAARWGVLKLMEQAGEIQNLRRQVRFPIVINGQKICVYVADFQYEHGSETIVEDAKGCRTDVYKLKNKLLKACNGIIITEV